MASIKRRTEIANAQHPLAVIIGCSDSRVSPELLFDKGLGEIFVVRVAGNIVGPLDLALLNMRSNISVPNLLWCLAMNVAVQ